MFIYFENNEMLLKIDELKKEAVKFRALLDKCNKTELRLITEDFPVCNCKLSSMLFTYHLLTKWPKILVFGVAGIAKDNNGRETISHYWLEVGGITIDLTADQYNVIDSSELNKQIVKQRPFNSIYVGFPDDVFHYGLFKVLERDKYIKGFPTVEEDFIEDMEISYKKLTEQMMD